MKLPKLLSKNNKDYMLNSIKREDNDIFESIYNSIHPGKLFIKIFKSYYSIFEVNAKIRIEEEKFIDALKSRYNLTNENILRIDAAYNNIKNRKTTDSVISKAFIILKHSLAVWIDYDEIIIFYNSRISKTEVLAIASLTDDYKKTEVKKKEFYMITKGEKDLILQNFELGDYNIDIENNYNIDFKDINGIITNTLNEKKKNGIILLHGTYGSGKTYYIRYLINTIARKFIYLPLNMVDWLSNPDFIPFMSKFRDSVLILEDCENLLMHRDDGNPNATALSNLLNFGDGLLSDALSLNIICSFNSNLKKIDDALLRKGRLIARYEFKELEIPKAQALADKLEKNIIVAKPMTLTDIYNAESMKFENKKANKIGFAYA
jgi:hypothetical protein